MRIQHVQQCSRRGFLGGVMLAGTAGLLGVHPRPAAAEPPPETTRIRLAQIQSICRAPQYLTEELLHSEGFTDAHYVVKKVSTEAAKALASGEVDITMQYIGPSIIQIDLGDPLVLLAGVQVGCFELFGTHHVRYIPRARRCSSWPKGRSTPSWAYRQSRRNSGRGTLGMS